MASSRHCYVEKTTDSVGIFIPRSLLPCAVEDYDIIELEPLGSMSGEQEQSVLSTSYVASPLCQRLQHVGSIGISISDIPRKLVNAFPEH